MSIKQHDRWYNSDIDELHDTWLNGDKNDRPQESWGMQLWEIAHRMEAAILIIRKKDADAKSKSSAANILREFLQECIWDENLSELTAIYKDEEVDNILGYDTVAISTFVRQMLAEYPKPRDLETGTVEPDFDCYDEHHMAALEDLMIDFVEGTIQPPDGVSLKRTMDDETGELIWDMMIGDVFIISYKSVDDCYSYTVNDDYAMINKTICGMPVLVELLQFIIRDNGY